MLIYFVMYFLILVGTPIVMRSGGTLEKRKNRGVAYITALITLVVALRHPSMGADLRYGLPYGYLGSFQSIANLPWLHVLAVSWQNYERGYIIFNKLLGYISTEYSCLLIGCGIASIVPIGIMIRKCSKDYVFSAIVYLGLPCFLMPFSGLRQSIAIGICCLAYLFIHKRKPLIFTTIVLSATLFHYSAFVFLIAYPLYHLRLSRQLRLSTIPCLAMIYVARYPLFSIASKLFKENAVASSDNATTLLIVFVLIYTFCTVFLRNCDEKSGGALNIFSFACVCQCFAGLFSTAMRVGFYFMPPLAIAMPNIIANMKRRNNYVLSRNFIMIIFTVYGLYALYRGSWAMTYPYHFFWSEVM